MENFKLTILGSGTAIPSKNRGNSGYLIEIGDEKILLDSGAGAIRKLPFQEIPVWGINKIFYSHMHIDHVVDLIPLLFASKYSGRPAEAVHNLEIFAHKDFNDYFLSIQKLFNPYISGDNIKTVFTPVNGNLLRLEGFNVKNIPVAHTPQSTAYRFELLDGRSLVYSGDTDYCEELVTIANNCSVLLVECSFPDDNDVKGHMTPLKISKLISKARPTRVILTHIYPINDDGTLVQRIENPFKIPIEVGEDLMQIVI